MNRKPIKDMSWEELVAEREFLTTRHRLREEQVLRLEEIDRAIVDKLPARPDPTDC